MNDDFHPQHYAKFASIAEKTSWGGSRKPRSWAVLVGADTATASALDDEKVNRAYLFDLCANSAIAPEQCFLAIMAWGGMKKEHGERAWTVRSGWIDLVEQLRAGILSREEAYERFWHFRKTNPGSGIGPAYYTKAIFFAHPSHDGYIMDQWTSLGVNLLTDNGAPSLIALSRGTSQRRVYFRVADTNPPTAYEEFCKTVERLARKLDLRSEEVEERLFSKGGRPNERGQWRKYVIEQKFTD